jgi:hypothetical protein
MIYIPGLINIGSGIQKLMRDSQTQTAWRSRKPTLGNYAEWKLERKERVGVPVLYALITTMRTPGAMLDDRLVCNVL